MAEIFYCDVCKFEAWCDSGKIQISDIKGHVLPVGEGGNKRSLSSDATNQWVHDLPNKLPRSWLSISPLEIYVVDGASFLTTSNVVF